MARLGRNWRASWLLLSVLQLGGVACKSSQGLHTESGTPGSGRLELARQFVGTGDYKKAVTFLLPMVKENPRSVDALMLLGLSYLGIGNVDAASDTYRRVVVLEDDNYDAVLNLGYTLVLKGKQRDARIQFQQILDAKEYPYMERVQTNIGLSYLQENRCDRGMPHFQEAVKLDPTFVQAYFNMGRCQLLQGQPKAAKENLLKAVDFCPECLEPALELAKAQARTGEKKAAIARIEELLRGKLDTANEARTRKILKEIQR